MFKQFVVTILLVSSPLIARGSFLTCVPDKFDFGWSPADAKISAKFTLKNAGGDALAVQSLDPTCGCTAANFTPANLNTNEETEVGLTFNTRGYNGMPFSKPSAVKTDKKEENLTVVLMGHVTPVQAKFLPEGTGVASFPPGSPKKQKLVLLNKTDKELVVSMVQKPDEWAEVDLKNTNVPAGGSLDVLVHVSNDLKELRNTSVTFEANGDAAPHRLTLAIKTGPEAMIYTPVKSPGTIQPSSAPAQPRLSKPAPAKPAQPSPSPKKKTDDKKTKK